MQLKCGGYRCSMVYVSVCLFDATVSPTKVAEPIGLWTQMGPR